MPIIEDRQQRHPAGADTTPALRRLASRGVNWSTALLMVFGPGALLVALLVLSPFLAVAFALGLAGTTVRYVVRRDWAALAHIGAGLGLIVVGFVTARGLVHGGLPTLDGWRTNVRTTAETGDSFGHAGMLLFSVGATLTYLGALALTAASSLYALVRPYRVRLPRPVVLAACTLVGAAVGFLG